MTTDTSHNGSMKTSIALSLEDRARFASRVAMVADAGSCWRWLGSFDAYGYGIIRVGGRDRKATHIALQLAGKPRPKGASALHSCDNRACVRPTHLRWGTQTENVKDMDARNRRVPPKGSRHGHAKLTEDTVRVIRASALPSAALAAMFNVKPGTIRDIRSRRRGAWKHV